MISTTTKKHKRELLLKPTLGNFILVRKAIIKINTKKIVPPYHHRFIIYLRQILHKIFNLRNYVKFKSQRTKKTDIKYQRTKKIDIKYQL